MSWPQLRATTAADPLRQVCEQCGNITALKVCRSGLVISVPTDEGVFHGLDPYVSVPPLLRLRDVSTRMGCLRRQSTHKGDNGPHRQDNDSTGIVSLMTHVTDLGRSTANRAEDFLPIRLSPSSSALLDHEFHCSYLDTALACPPSNPILLIHHLKAGLLFMSRGIDTTLPSMNLRILPHPTCEHLRARKCLRAGYE